MASSSITPQPKYDVFLSFRGQDTRSSFVSHLYAALTHKRIATFIDDDGLNGGHEISQSLLEVVEEAKISVIIFSKDYANSTWCLNELVNILECRERYGQIVIPVFYHVDPSEVRKQTGSFAIAFAKHEERLRTNLEMVLRWRTALTKATDLSGWDTVGTRPESSLVDAIVKDILRKLDHMSQRDDKCLIGLESRVEKIQSLLSTGSEGVSVVGIWGMGGIGKTTLASAVYNKVSSQFESSCFINNVREESERRGGLTILRQKLLSIILNESLNTSTVDHVSIFIKKRLACIKVLIVLDDVTHFRQIEFLVGDLNDLGPGSWIIITTRDKQVLHSFGINGIYEVNGLSYVEALELFCRYAFRENNAMNDYLELSKGIVEYCKGNPLALTVLGSSLFGKGKQQWENAFYELNKIPVSLFEVLKVSYDGLDCEVQAMFLDIASSFTGEDVNYAVKTLSDLGYSAERGITILIDKSLITITNNKITMHDLVKEMGSEIRRRESTRDPDRNCDT